VQVISGLSGNFGRKSLAIRQAKQNKEIESFLTTTSGSETWSVSRDVLELRLGKTVLTDGRIASVETRLIEENDVPVGLVLRPENCVI